MARKSKEANRVYYKSYYASHKEAYKVAQEKYHRRVPRIHIPDSRREHRLQYLYKMTVEMYEALLSSQEGHCALCPATQESNTRRMAVDHNHECCSGKRSCGKCLRGILCANCNRMVGFLEKVLQESVVIPQPNSWIEKATRYIDSYKTYQELK